MTAYITPNWRTSTGSCRCTDFKRIEMPLAELQAGQNAICHRSQLDNRLIDLADGP
jgi:hypothetical protein